MKRRTRILAAVSGGALVLALAGGAWALANGDSLISLSYLSGSYHDSLLAEASQAADQTLQSAYQSAESGLKEQQSQYLAQVGAGSGSGSYSATLAGRALSLGDTVAVGTGAGILLIQGSATVTHDGALIDATQGTEVASGGRLTAGHPDLVGEATQAGVTVISGAAELGVQGGYTLQDSALQATPFYDVCQQDWYYDQVDYVYFNGLFSGMEEHLFSPDTTMNRAMLVTVLYRLAGSPQEELEAATATFSDVPEDAWYAPYVRWAASNSVTAGTGANTFSPDMAVTRQQIVVLLYSFGNGYLGLDFSGRADLSGYTDLDQVDDWGREAISWGVDAGILNSTSDSALTLDPQRSATRAEVATMLRNFAEKFL